jgi:hypothetical protein
VVSNFIVQALRNEPITIYGDGSQTRSFCYYTDLIDGLIKLFFNEEIQGPVNLGNPSPIAMNTLASEIIEIIGTKQNVLMAEFVFYFLKERINSLWENYQKINIVPNRYKLSYQKGILDGFQNKLNKIQREKVKNLNSNDMNKNEIMLILQNEDLKLNSFTKNLYPKLTKKGATSNKVYTSYFDEGKNEGKKIILNKPMNESTNKNILLK